MLIKDDWEKYLKQYKFADNRLAVFEKFIKETPMQKHELTDSVCFCEKKNDDYFISYVNKNEIYTDEYNANNKRKIFNVLSNYNIIIIKGLPFEHTNIYNKIILRYEVVINMLTSNISHYFNDNLLFSNSDNSVFLTKEFKNILESNVNLLKFLSFSSFMLNNFELGFVANDIKLKPTINVSRYGRWYWNNTEKIQTDKIARHGVYDKLLNYGRIINIDLLSGEPTILSELSHSNTIKQLIDFRVDIKNTDIETNKAIKNLLNVFIHSIEEPEIATDRFCNKYDCQYIEKLLGINILSVLRALQNELLWYNNIIIKTYRENFCTNELLRRIFIPETPILTDRELVKEHRKFLQGHTHDRIINLVKLNFRNTGLMPIFTIHDSISYFVSNKYYKNICENLKNNAKELQYPITIELLE